MIMLLALLAAPAASKAQVPQRPPFSSDRPGFADQAAIMTPGLWQAELGGTFRGEGSDEFLLGSALLRTSLAGVEARFTFPTAFVRHEGGFLQLGDIGVGVKVPLDLSLGGAWWKWAALGTMNLPTGSEAVNAPSAGAAAKLVGQVELEGDATVTLNAGYGFLFDHVGSGTVSFVATPEFPFPGRPGMRAYAGLASYVRSGDDDYFVEWGLTRMAGTDRQWDLNAGYDPGSHTWFLGIGVAERRSW
jgi:hypothetical protein